MKKLHHVQGLDFERDKLILKVDGEKYVFSLKVISKKLLRASREEREKFSISSSGYGIHWPLVDEDLSIDGLIGAIHAHPVFKRKKIAV